MIFDTRTFFGFFTRFLLLHVCVSLSSSGWLFAQHLTKSDIIAGYKVNASLFQGARICYRQIVESKFDNRMNLEAVYDYWSDGQNFLVRGGNIKQISDPENILSGRFPDTITSSDLKTIYKKLPVISYDAQEKLGYRWSVFDNGSSTEEEYKGNIVGRSVFDMGSDNFFNPPFMTFDLAKTDSTFPSDSFFLFPESDIYLIVTQTIDGKEYYVFESRFEYPEGLYRFQDKDINFYDVRRAWIDVQKGCIPIRIEYHSMLYKRGYPVDHNGQFIDYVVPLHFSNMESCMSVFEIQQIQKIGNGFYPVRASHRLMGVSKERNEQIQKAFNGTNEGGVVDIGDSPLYEVQLENKWEISNVILDVAINRATLVLPFPEGTIIFDDRTDNIRLAGMTEREY